MAANPEQQCAWIERVAGCKIQRGRIHSVNRSRPQAIGDLLKKNILEPR
jgi:hypothetical protein